MSQKVKIKSKVYFKHYTVHHYSDGTYRFEDYAPYFEGIVEAITWGRAYQEAEKQVNEGQKKIAQLREEAVSSLVGVKWAELEVSY